MNLKHWKNNITRGCSFRTASRWSQFVIMMMAQLSSRNSLRGIVDNVSAQAHRLYHLGSTKLSPSNLSRINDDKSYALYIEFTGAITAKKCPVQLRHISYRDAVTVKRYIFLTNNFKLAAKMIADIYKARWQVELFFKWIKQNLKIKSFVGTSKNTMLTQTGLRCVSIC